jgi:hypothetical protein
MKATCPCGPKLTHGFEGTVTREIFQQVRRQSGVKGKKRKRGADAFLLPVYEKFAEPFDVAPSRKVSIDDHPSMLFIPRIQPLKRLGTQQSFQVMEGKPVPFDLWQPVPDIDYSDTRWRHCVECSVTDQWFGAKQIDVFAKDEEAADYLRGLALAEPTEVAA